MGEVVFYGECEEHCTIEDKIMLMHSGQGIQEVQYGSIKLRWMGLIKNDGGCKNKSITTSIVTQKYIEFKYFARLVYLLKEADLTVLFEYKLLNFSKSWVVSYDLFM